MFEGLFSYSSVLSAVKTYLWITGIADQSFLLRVKELSALCNYLIKL